MPTVLASRRTSGISTITTGVLLTKAGAVAAPISISTTVRRGALPARRITRLASASIVPVRTSAPDRTKNAAMVIGAELANDAVTSGALSHPSAIMTPAPNTAMVTGGNRSRAKAMKSATMKASPSNGRYASSKADTSWIGTLPLLAGPTTVAGTGTTVQPPAACQARAVTPYPRGTTSTMTSPGSRRSACASQKP